MSPVAGKCEVCVKIDLTVKVAAFCRELGDNTLQEMAQRDKKTDDAYKRAVKSFEDGRIGSGLEADLDLLDDMVRRDDGQGLYPPTRAYQPLPDPGRGQGRSGGRALAVAARAGDG